MVFSNEVMDIMHFVLQYAKEKGYEIGRAHV